MRSREEDTPPAIEERPWNTQRAANFLGIHPATVTEMARDGRIPAIKVGRVWRFRPSSLQRWMDEQEQRQRPSA